MPVGVVAVQPVDLAVGVVKGRVERDATTSVTSFGTGCVRRFDLREIARGQKEPRLQFVRDVERVAANAGHAERPGDAAGDVLHARERLVVSEFAASATPRHCRAASTRTRRRACPRPIRRSSSR